MPSAQCLFDIDVPIATGVPSPRSCGAMELQVVGCKWVEKYRGGKGVRGQGGVIPEIIVEWFGPLDRGYFQPPEKQHLVRNSDIYFRREGREEINVGRFFYYRGTEKLRG